MSAPRRKAGRKDRTMKKSISCLEELTVEAKEVDALKCVEMINVDVLKCTEARPELTETEVENLHGNIRFFFNQAFATLECGINADAFNRALLEDVFAEVQEQTDAAWRTYDERGKDDAKKHDCVEWLRVSRLTR